MRMPRPRRRSCCLEAGGGAGGLIGLDGGDGALNEVGGRLGDAVGGEDGEPLGDALAAGGVNGGVPPIVERLGSRSHGVEGGVEGEGVSGVEQEGGGLVGEEAEGRTIGVLGSEGHEYTLGFQSARARPCAGEP